MEGETTFADIARTGASLVLQRIASVREQQEDSYGAVEALQAVALLFCMTLLPALVRIRILYTFCWVGFTVIAHYTDSQAALGLATSLGLTIMLGWYSLRAIVDRSTFLGILQGWFGFLSKFTPFRLLCNTVDVLLHMMVPLVLALCYLPLVRLWMTIPILIFSQMWIYFIAGGDLYPNGNHVYHFYPPRSKAFWTAARKIELFFNVTVPLGCVFAYNLGLHQLIVDRLILS